MPSSKDFFAQRRAAAAFKHGILARYPAVFAGKAGSVTAGRVTFLDGYAGPGSYDDGSPGSPLLFVRAAQLMKNARAVTAIFVEQDRQHYKRLCDVLAQALPSGTGYRTVEGDLGMQLPGLLPATAGSALFAFLDPFGTALGRDQLRTDLLGRAGRALTEVLLHFQCEHGRPHRRVAAQGQPRRTDADETDKAVVLSLVHYESREVRSRVVPNVTGETLLPAINQEAKLSSTWLQSDGGSGYKTVARHVADHSYVDHAAGVYVGPGGVGTNLVEGYFSQFKRSIDGTHHHISREHLSRYLAQFDWLYTHFKASDSVRMRTLIDGTAGVVG